MTKKMEANDAWDLLVFHKAVGSKCAFKLKINVNRLVDCYKASSTCIVQGFSQKFVIMTFCPVVKFESVRTVIS